MTTLNNRPNIQPLTGKALLAKIKELGDVSKMQLAIECGYIKGHDAQGEPIPAFTKLYEAILESKGFSGPQGLTGKELLDRIRDLGPDLCNEDLLRATGWMTGSEADDTVSSNVTGFENALKAAKAEEDGEPLINGLTTDEFREAINDGVRETRKVHPNDPQLADKVACLVQLRDLRNYHQQVIQRLEQEGKSSEEWIADVERINVCLSKLLAVSLGEDDRWYLPEENGSDTVEASSRPATVELKVFTDVVKKANALQAEVDELKAQLKPKKRGLLQLLFPPF